jgi:hypothetical protein
MTLKAAHSSTEFPRPLRRRASRALADGHPHSRVPMNDSR